MFLIIINLCKNISKPVFFYLDSSPDALIVILYRKHLDLTSLIANIREEAVNRK